MRNAAAAAGQPGNSLTPLLHPSRVAGRPPRLPPTSSSSQNIMLYSIKLSTVMPNLAAWTVYLVIVDEESNIQPHTPHHG